MDGRLPSVSHYFDEEPERASDERDVDVVLPDVSFRLRTDRGVFSHGRLDTGTGILLRSAVAVPSTGDLLDLGCGAGAVSLTLARRAPGATVWAVDVNARARALCERNAESNALANVRVVAPDDVDPDLRFRAIWSNPPIRIGKQALHLLLTSWLGRLADDGEAVLVVQRHLGADSLQRWLESCGHRTERVASHAGYRVLRVAATRPSDAGRVDRDPQAAPGDSSASS
jgi:16S rRNA (guanine1207-N2)-methyltransferase